MKIPEETIYFVATDFNPLKICDDKFKVATICVSLRILYSM